MEDAEVRGYYRFFAVPLSNGSMVIKNKLNKSLSYLHQNQKLSFIVKMRLPHILNTLCFLFSFSLFWMVSTVPKEIKRKDTYSIL